MTRILNSLIKRYKTMSLPIKAGFWFTVCNFLQRGITMITTPVFTRVLSEEQYGVVSTFTSWQSVLLLVTSLSLYKAMMNLYVKHDNREKVLSALCGLSLTITMTWLAVYLVFSRQISLVLGMSQILTTYLFLYCIAQAGILCWMTYKRYMFDYRRVVFVTLLMTVFSSALGLIGVLLLSDTAEGRLIPQTLVVVAIGICVYIAVFKNNKSFYDKGMWSFSISFCVGLMPHYLSEFILQSSDKLMINYMCGSKDVAIYSIAYSVGTLINLVTSAINSAFAPYQYQQIKGGNYKQLAKRANAVLLFVAIILSVVMLFGREIVLIFGGKKYIESTEVIIPICIGIFFNYLFQLFARVQEYYNRKITVVIPSVLCAILNLILNYIFINLYGYQAASYTTFACYMIFCIMHYFFYKKVCKKELKGIALYDIKGVLLISGGVIVSGVVLFFINTVLWLKYTIILLVISVIMIEHKRALTLVMKIFQQS